jgi:hypothetical protein
LVKDKEAEEAAQVLLGLRETRLTPSASVSPPVSTRNQHEHESSTWCEPNRIVTVTLMSSA